MICANQIRSWLFSLLILTFALLITSCNQAETTDEPRKNEKQNIKDETENDVITSSQVPVDNGSSAQNSPPSQIDKEPDIDKEPAIDLETDSDPEFEPGFQALEEVVVGRIAEATVRFYDVSTPAMPLVLETTTSNVKSDDINEIGKITNIDPLFFELDRTYLVEVTGGVNLDSQRDGSIDTETPFLGKLRLIASGNQLSERNWKVSALTEVAYQRSQFVREHSENLHQDLLHTFLDDEAKRLITTDLNEDGVINYSDLILWSPDSNLPDFIGDSTVLVNLTNKLLNGEEVQEEIATISLPFTVSLIERNETNNLGMLISAYDGQTIMVYGVNDSDKHISIINRVDLVLPDGDSFAVFLSEEGLPKILKKKDKTLYFSNFRENIADLYIEYSDGSTENYSDVALDYSSISTLRTLAGQGVFGASISNNIATPNQTPNLKLTNEATVKFRKTTQNVARNSHLKNIISGAISAITSPLCLESVLGDASASGSLSCLKTINNFIHGTNDNAISKDIDAIINAIDYVECAMLNVWSCLSIAGATDIDLTGDNDTTPPDIYFFSAPGRTHAGTFTAHFSVSDNTGIQHVQYSIDEQFHSLDVHPPYAVSIDTTQLTDGEHILKIDAWDTAETNNIATKTFNFFVDNTKLRLNISSPVSFQSYTGNLNVMLNSNNLFAKEIIGTVDLVLTNIESGETELIDQLTILDYDNYQYTIDTLSKNNDVRNTPNGEYTIEVIAYNDTDEIIETGSQEDNKVSFWIANPPESVEFTSPTAGQKLAEKIQIALKASHDVSKVVYELEDKDGTVHVLENEEFRRPGDIDEFNFSFELDTSLFPNNTYSIIAYAYNVYASNVLVELVTDYTESRVTVEFDNGPEITLLKNGESVDQTTDLSAHSFGDLIEGEESTPQQFSINNFGVFPLTVTSITSSNPAFVVDDYGLLGHPITSEISRVFDVTFSPEFGREGLQTSIISVESNDPKTPKFEFMVLGRSTPIDCSIYDELVVGSWQMTIGGGTYNLMINGDGTGVYTMGDGEQFPMTWRVVRWNEPVPAPWSTTHWPERPLGVEPGCIFYDEGFQHFAYRGLIRSNLQNPVTGFAKYPLGGPWDDGHGDYFGYDLSNITPNVTYRKQ